MTNIPASPLGPRLGVIGGGQLARMMTVPAINLGLDVKVLAEIAGSSAQLAATQVGDYRDLDTVRAFAETVDTITFDHEHVPQPILNALIEAGKSVQPGPTALALAQNKIVMREQLQALGLPMPRWAAVHNETELAEFLKTEGGRCIVKTPTGGYDGKGVRLISDATEAADWFAASGNQPLLAEEAVDFVRELAQLSARSTTGEFRTWPLVETVQLNGVCAEVLAPAPNTSETQRQAAADIASTVAEQIGNGAGVTGVLAVELFERANGELVINELAMRPHNSGHFTIEASATSQFEQHLRAVLGLPLGDTAMRAPAAVMINILGGPAADSEKPTLASRLPDAAAVPEAKIHLYGKDPRPGRKVGHVTVLGADIATARDAAKRAAATFD